MCAFSILSLLFIWSVVYDIEDWIACWRSPETMDGVDCVVALDRGERFGLYDSVRVAPSRFDAQSAIEVWRSMMDGAIDHHGVERDFDGDGVPDALEISYYHMEPLFRRSTSAMVLLESGSTGEVLLGYATPTPFDKVYWCGDVDGNGTQDVLIEDYKQAVVLGHRGRGR